MSILEKIEATSSYRFNYDPDLLQAYQFSGQLDYAQPEIAIAQLFKETPLTYSIYEQKVLIFLAPKKRWRICGYVIDGATNLPLPYTNVFGPDLKTGDQTDEVGYFEFFYEGFKHERIQMSFIGYKTQEYALQSFDSLNCQSFLLNPDPSLFVHPVVITDYLIDGITEGESYSRLDLNYNQINNWYTNVEQDVLKTIQLIPGVTSINESAGDIQIRGSTVDQTLLLWEGATLYGPGHLFGSISSINPFVINDIKVYKGVFDPSYANRVGGIIDMSLSNQIPDKVSGSVGSTFSEVHANVELPILKDQLALIISGRNTTNLLFNSPTLNRFSNKLFQNTKVQELKADGVAEEELAYADWNAKINFRPNEKWHLKASIFNSYNNFNFNALLGDDAEFESQDDVEYQSQALNTAVTWQWASNWETTLSFNYSAYQNNYDFNMTVRADDDLIERNNVLNSIGESAFTIKNKVDLTKESAFEFGYEYNFKEVNFDRDFAGIYGEDFTDFNFIEASFHNLFTAFQHQGEKTQLNLGLRTIYYQETQNLAWSPRLNYQYQLTPHIKWKFSAGILHQYINQLKEFGDTELPLNNRVWIINRTEEQDGQKAEKIASGLVMQKAGWLVDLEAYFHQVDGLNTLAPVLPLDNDVTGITSGSSRNMGFDILVKKKWNQYNFWLNYSWAKVEFNFPELRDNPFPGSNDLRHNLSALGAYKWKNWLFSLQYQFRTGLPYSPATDIAVFEELETDETYFELVYNDFNNQRLPHYQRLDFSINYQLKWDNATQLDLALSFLNLFNRENLFSRDYFIDFEEDVEVPTFFSEDKFLLRRTPQVLVRFSW